MTSKPDIADLYRRLYDFDHPLDNSELLIVLANARETHASLKARGPFWGLATEAMREEVETLEKAVRARGMKP